MYLFYRSNVLKYFQQLQLNYQQAFIKQGLMQKELSYLYFLKKSKPKEKQVKVIME